jgi:hypothetical protein
MQARTMITVLVSMMVAGVLFGAGATAILSIESLSQHASVLLPAVVILSLLAAPVISWLIAPTMRAAYSRRMENKSRMQEARSAASAPLRHKYHS